MAKVLTGKVVSTKMDKTAVVEVEKSFRHKLYHKILKRHKRFKAHLDGSIVVNDGDVVDIEETRPISKDKQFKVIKKY
jgi:small subunit ribosomal protein S17